MPILNDKRIHPTHGASYNRLPATVVHKGTTYRYLSDTPTHWIGEDNRCRRVLIPLSHIHHCFCVRSIHFPILHGRMKKQNPLSPLFHSI